MEKSLRLYVNLAKTLWFLLVCMVFTLAGLYTVLNSRGTLSQIAGWSFIAIFGVGAMIILYMLLTSGQPAIEFNEQGISIHHLLLHNVMTWDEIASIQIDRQEIRLGVTSYFLIVTAKNTAQMKRVTVGRLNNQTYRDRGNAGITCPLILLFWWNTPDKSLQLMAKVDELFSAQIAINHVALHKTLSRI